MGTKQTLIQAIMVTHDALERCQSTGNAEWAARHKASLTQLCALLPSGSGVDDGTTTVELTAGSATFACGFHHMDEHGRYDGWTQHTITVRPDWCGPLVAVVGENRDDINEHLHSIYEDSLTTPVEYRDGTWRWHDDATLTQADREGR